MSTTPPLKPTPPVKTYKPPTAAQAALLESAYEHSQEELAAAGVPDGITEAMDRFKEGLGIVLPAQLASARVAISAIRQGGRTR